ncbi:hypothetical protein J1605_007842 [Eschrichtius robustus]|uniref:Small ribosomal subunit protein uS2 C-terminal domain-containing protein n=1 Tax=Eschrichtius robustus TaxID=9764 RepID=A0AB34H2A0_ESCRO|nr:hypothetical protein J1605_011384 [Eschrichtius robustus]KAJ8784815.1 hypothetical protein J1605_007842 [Eschrichtius robustus]
MSRALDFLQMKEEDVLKFLAAGTHLGGTNLDFQMEQYIYKRKSDGVYNINLKRTWEKLLLAAHATVAIENPADWTLAREVLCMRGTISRKHPWEVIPDLCFYGDPEEIEKEEQAAAEKAVTMEEFQAPSAQATEWVGTTTEWS